MNRVDAIATVKPKVLEVLLDGIQESYHGKIEADTVLDQGWDSLDLIEILMNVEDALHLEIHDDFIDTVFPDFSEIEKFTPREVVTQALDELPDDKLIALVAHIAKPGDARLAIDLPAK